MKNTIKKAPVQFWKICCSFSILCRFLFLLQVSDYHHLNLTYAFGQYRTKCRKHDKIQVVNTYYSKTVSTDRSKTVLIA